MPSENYRRVCTAFLGGHRDTAGYSEQDYELLENALMETENIDIKGVMAEATRNLVRAGVEKEKVKELTGYTRQNINKIFREVLNNELPVTLSNVGYLDEVCKRFGLVKNKTIKEQWFNNQKIKKTN